MKNNNLKSYRRTLMMFVLLLGAFLTLLTETLINNALPSIMKAFDISQATAQWLSTAYLLVAGLMVPISAWVFKRYSVRSTVLVMLSIFLLGSIIGYVANDFWWLVVARIVQAVAAGSLMPLVQNVTLLLYPAEKRGAALGMTGIVVSFGPALGPTLSGWIVDNAGWRDLFGILIPLTVALVIASFFFVKDVTQTSQTQLDARSLIYSTLGFGTLLYGLSDIGNAGKITVTTLLALLVGVVIVAMFVYRQLHTDNPLIELRVFSSHRFSLTTILSSISNIALLSVELVMPLYLQNVRGDSALISGLIMLPGALLMGVLSPITGRLYDRFGIYHLSLVGYSILILGTIPMMFFTHATALWLVMVAYAIRVVGIAFVMMPTFTAGINALPDKLSVYGNAAGSTVRQIAGSLGTAVVMLTISLATSVSTGHGANHLAALTNGYQAAFVISLIMAVIGLVLSFGLYQRKAVVTSKKN